MYSDQLFKQSSVEEKNFNQTPLSEARSDEPILDDVTIPNTLMHWGPIGFIMAWIVLFLMLSKIWTVKKDEIVAAIQHSQQLRCRNCHFFSNNPYLKCALHPSIVLTEQALDCSDYRVGDRKFSH
jgi:hypothetical protein